jgi:hypothetical protein
MRTSDSGIGDKKTVDIITSAWKNLRPPERIEKVLVALKGKLSEAEEARILWLAVLTPDEYRAVTQDSPLGVASTRRSGGKKPAPKRKAVGKRKRAGLR